MKISKIAIHRPIASSLIFLLIVLIGIIGFQNLNIDLFPEIVFPSGAVIVEYEGAGPEEVEQLVARPVEEALSSLEDVENVESSSYHGEALVTVNFAWGTDMDFAILDMREYIDRIEDVLPDGAGDPLIMKFDPSMLPVVEASVTGKDLVELRSMVKDDIQPRLERLSGVASVAVSGGREREIHVNLDTDKLNHYGLNINQVGEFIAAENINLPAGDMKVGDQEYNLRSMGEFDDWRQLQDIRITSPDGQQVRLTEIGEIKAGFAKKTHITRMNHEKSVGLSIQKEGDANTVAVSRKVNAELEQIEEEMADDIKIDIGLDQADFIENSINNLMKNAVLGAILAILMLLIFLGNVRTTVIIGIVIPFSIITTFALLYFEEMTLNMMTMGGLALGVGMLVDNSIVVLENIYRLREEGKDSLSAAEEGSNQVAAAIITSTITTAVVFLPIVFIEGLASQLFSELAMTVAFSLAASLFMALTLLPMLSRFLLAKNKNWRLMKIFQEKIFNPFFSAVQYLFKTILNFSLNNPLLAIIVVIILITGGYIQFRIIGTEFLPDMDQGELNIELELAPGTPIEKTEEVAADIEKVLLSQPEVKSVFSTIGSGEGGVASTGGEGANSAQIKTRLISSTKRDKSMNELMAETRLMLSEIPGADYEVKGSELMGAGLFGDPLVVQIHGYNLEVLEKYTGKIEEIINTIPGTQGVDSNLEQGSPELQIKYNRKRLHQQGLSATEVGNIVNMTMEGTAVSRWRHQGEEYDIRVSGDQKKSSLQTLKDLKLLNSAGKLVPLSEIADLEYTTGPEQINRVDQERTMEVTSDIVGRDLGSVEEELIEKLEQIDFPSGYRYTIGGEMEEMGEAFSQLFFALILAIILVYIVLGAQFESLVHPFIIMLAVPLALSGALVGLAIAGHTINVVALIGIIMLVGIVVNNVIVLIDYIEQLLDEGYELREAIERGAEIRLRPIMMTSLTTMFAMIPLALGLGEGAEMQAPMAVAVISGLFIATFLTLNVIPVFYYLIKK
ncbi:MAG: efflux RND transporter permease subunit [Halanaerobiales bacterium]